MQTDPGMNGSWYEGVVTDYEYPDKMVIRYLELLEPDEEEVEVSSPATLATARLHTLPPLPTRSHILQQASTPFHTLPHAPHTNPTQQPPPSPTNPSLPHLLPHIPFLPLSPHTLPTPALRSMASPEEEAVVGGTPPPPPPAAVGAASAA